MKAGAEDWHAGDAVVNCRIATIAHRVLCNQKMIRMQRIAFKMKLFKGKEDEYRRRHDEIWPELKTLLKKTGIFDYSIFIDETTSELFACLSVGDSRDLDQLAKEAVMKKWWAYMKDIMETNEDNSPVSVSLKQMFYLT